MKKILIGICGIGNGHINRQKSIINVLLEEYDVEMVLAITQQNYELFNKLYPNLKKVRINIPWIVCDKNGLNFEETLKIYKNSNINQFEKFLEFSIDVSKSFGNSLPDIIISDYEPNVAQYAYAIDKPLICMEQQSKFLYIKTDLIKEYSIDEEISRLKYFFPKVNTRFISSFFEIEPNNEVRILPPIFKKITRGKVDDKKVLVYFSPYTKDVNDFEKILELIVNYKEYVFNVYTNLNFPKYNYNKNLVFRKIGESFEKDLYDCKFIISSSGHQLISEAINLQIPLYIFPLKTFEQNYNCNMVEKYNLGKKISICDKNEFNTFLVNINKYIKNMENYKNKYWKNDWKILFLKEMEQKYNITKKKKN